MQHEPALSHLLSTVPSTEAWKSLTDKVQEARSNAQLQKLSFEGEATVLSALHTLAAKVSISDGFYVEKQTPRFSRLWQVSMDCGCWGLSTRPWSSCWSRSTAPGTAAATASASTSRRRAASLPSTPTARPAQRSATGQESASLGLPRSLLAPSEGRCASSNCRLFAVQEVRVRHV